MATKRVIDAVSVGADHVVCPCGEVIELEPNPEAPDVDLQAALSRSLLVSQECGAFG
jgi:hypothetical protein